MTAVRGVALFVVLVPGDRGRTYGRAIRPIMQRTSNRGTLAPVTRAISSFVALLLFGLSFAPGASAQTRPAARGVLVLVVDPGPTRVNVDSIRRAIETATTRTVVRLTDDRAPGAAGRLTIAFSNPDRWVLRYEASGQVGWVTDRIARPGTLQARLAELSRDLVGRVEGGSEARRRQAWDEDVILALQNEIVDPFEDDPPRASHTRPVTVLWSEVVDPFTDRAPRAEAGEVWSEVLDPWAMPAPVRRR